MDKPPLLGLIAALPDAVWTIATALVLRNVIGHWLPDLPCRRLCQPTIGARLVADLKSGDFWDTRVADGTVSGVVKPGRSDKSVRLLEAGCFALWWGEMG